MTEGTTHETHINYIFNELVTVPTFDDLKLDLLVKSRNEMSAHRVAFLSAEQTQIFALLQGVSFEVFEELLRHGASDLTSLFALLERVINSLLQVSSIDLVISASLSCLNSLSLHKHGFSRLFVLCVVLSENCILMGLNHLDSGLLEGLAN